MPEGEERCPCSSGEPAEPYVRLKEGLAERFSTDRVGYALPETEFAQAAPRAAR